MLFCDSPFSMESLLRKQDLFHLPLLSLKGAGGEYVHLFEKCSGINHNYTHQGHPHIRKIIIIFTYFKRCRL
ncbi:Uncharacterised protein [Segatella buccae]|uniref:Uncharacterized protein n=1 Tax=Segatella buccae TaxID=28126 RepID=A0AAQ1ZIU2_9BACT|nr:Uncharacterised protein [Segatella buccae]